MTELGLIGIGALAVIALGIIIWIYGKRKEKKVFNIGKVIGASEARDPVRSEVIAKADKQIEKNEEVIAKAEKQIKKNVEIIARSNEAIEKARRIREKISANLSD